MQPCPQLVSQSDSLFCREMLDPTGICPHCTSRPKLWRLRHRQFDGQE